MSLESVTRNHSNEKIIDRARHCFCLNKYLNNLCTESTKLDQRKRTIKVWDISFCLIKSITVQSRRPFSKLPFMSPLVQINVCWTLIVDGWLYWNRYIRYIKQVYKPSISLLNLIVASISLFSKQLSCSFSTSPKK